MKLWVFFKNILGKKVAKKKKRKKENNLVRTLKDRINRYIRNILESKVDKVVIGIKTKKG